VVSGIAYHAIRKTENGIALDVSREGQNTTIDTDQVLITTGRTPNIEGLGLTGRGVAVSPRGGIIADDRMRATGPNHRSRPRRYDLSVPHDRQRAEARGPLVRQERRQAVLLRRLNYSSDIHSEPRSVNSTVVEGLLAGLADLRVP